MLQRHERPHCRSELFHPSNRHGGQQSRALPPRSWVHSTSAPDSERAGKRVDLHGSGGGVGCPCGANSDGRIKMGNELAEGPQ